MENDLRARSYLRSLFYHPGTFFLHRRYEVVQIASVIMGLIRSAVLSALALAAACRGMAMPAAEAEAPVEKRASTYWYENIAHQGIAPFAPSGYTVYRNVKDFGAKGNYLRLYHFSAVVANAESLR